MIQRAKAHKRPPEKIAPKTPLVPCGTEATDPVENDPFIAFGKAMIQSVGLAARLKASSSPSRDNSTAQVDIVSRFRAYEKRHGLWI